MRKLMLLAAMLAMVLVAAAPALAQATVNSDDDTDNSTNQYVDCTQVLDAMANQTQYGDANAAADEATSIAEISQELGISQEAVQNCVNAGEDADVTGNTGDVDVTKDGVDNDGDGVVDEGDGSETAEVVVVDGVDNDGDGVVDEADGSEAAAAASASAAASSSAAGTSVLPDTGGASLFTLGAGALLVGGGLLARRIFS